jgi:hypothetical protein
MNTRGLTTPVFRAHAASPAMLKINEAVKSYRDEVLDLQLTGQCAKFANHARFNSPR